LATPITVKFEQLRPGEGYDPRKEAPNFGPVWQGGEWHIRDITNTMTTVAFFLLKHAAQNREHWLQRFYEIEKDAVRPRKSGELAGFEFYWNTQPPASDEKAKRLVEILKTGGVELNQDLASGFYLRNRIFVKIAQPYGSFAKALLELQHYPDLRDSSGQPIRPYDVTAHSLALLMDVKVEPIYAPFKEFANNGVIKSTSHANPYDSKGIKFALYKSHVPAFDEGWTRWILDRQFAQPMPYSSLEDAEARRGNLRAKYDSIIIPDQPRAAILSGHRRIQPYGMAGGAGAALGRNSVERAGGSVIELGGTDKAEMQPGDCFVVETPGGGGYGKIVS